MRFPKMTSILKETLKPPKTKVVRTDGLMLVVYVTGDSPESAVFLEVSGGSEAISLCQEIKGHLKK